MSQIPEPTLVIGYDGVCVTCHWFVKQVARSDTRGRFHFSPLQGSFFSHIRARGLPDDKPDSVLIVIHPGQPDESVLSESDAVLFIAGRLTGWWRLLLVGRLFPVAVRNGLYRLIAANRHRFARRYDYCERPAPDVLARHLP